jgi:hypothetical protein
MKYCVTLLAALAATLSSLSAATAGDLPQIKTSERNMVPECATPGRLMAFLRDRNGNLDPRFEKIAIYYMRYGEELGLRWDYAFFQMLIETGYLTFKRDGNRDGLVKSAQNNFAGLGAVGKGESGESFKDVATGVLAHLQHVMMYAGEKIENPVAERTRKVMEWGVLTNWQSKIKGPMTYEQLAKRWASSSQYAEAIESHGERFYDRSCKQPDPNPEFVREARGMAPEKKPAAETPMAAATTRDKPKPSVSGVELARQAIEDGKLEGNTTRSGLGAGSLAKAVETTSEAPAAKETTPAAFTLLNGLLGDTSAKPDRSEKKADKPASVQTASAAGALAKPQPPVAPAKECRVWTASYGGQKAVIIRAQGDDAVNYTVLDVNDGVEKREADAYIAAYAKGGVIAGEFSSQAQALDKAFELCPEG